MKDSTVNIEKNVLHELKVYCAIIESPLGDFVEAAIREKIGRESNE